uniref:Uncharacterized protein n=2 Tax=Auxenochlorella protothecoides TaxID=3075 RepID=A0A1D2ACQ3_AUXPR
MTTSSPPAKRQLTLRKACAGPRTSGETERQTQYALFNEHKIQELHGLADGYVQAWTARCSALSMTGDRAPVRPGTSMKPDPEAHEQHLDTAEMLDTAGFRYVEACQRCLDQAIPKNQVLDRHSIEHLVLVLRCDGLHGSRAVSAGAARVLVSAALAFPPANLCWHTQGPHSGQPFVTFSDAGVWSPVGLELAGFSWKRLMWADMAASGARLGEGDRAQHRRGPPGARRLHSPLELLVHLFEVASGPPVPGRAGEVAFLQYLFMVLRVDLDARLQAFENMATVESEGLKGRRAALLEHSLLARIYSGELHLTSNDTRAALVGLLVRCMAAPHDDVEGQTTRSGAAVQVADMGPLLPVELAGLAAEMLRALLSLCGAMEGAGLFHRIHRGRTGAHQNHRMGLDRALLAAAWEGGAGCSDAGACAVLAALPPRDRLRLLGLLVARQFQRSTIQDQVPEGPSAALSKAAHLLEDGADAWGYVDVDPGAALAFVLSDLAAPTARSFQSLSRLAVVVGGLASALAGQPGLLARGAGAERVPADVPAALQAALRGIVDKAGRTSLGASQDLSRTALFQLMYSQMAVESLAARMQTAA